MATNAGPMYYDATKGDFVWYDGWINQGENQSLRAKDLPNYNDVANPDNNPYMYPGFAQQWGARGYFIFPEYLDPFSMYRPQTLAEGYIPAAGTIGQYR